MTGTRLLDATSDDDAAGKQQVYLMKIGFLRPTLAVQASLGRFCRDAFESYRSYSCQELCIVSHTIFGHTFIDATCLISLEKRDPPKSEGGGHGHGKTGAQNTTINN